VSQNGNLVLVTPALGDTQNAACWLVVTQDGKVAYTANSASGTISSYTVSPGGNLSLLSEAAASLAGGAPIDMTLSNNSRFLYVRDANNADVSGFRIEPDGTLTPISVGSGVPSGAQGIAASVDT
jgi:6-phosphogluconolactonase (cycloisomerase 2 family)